mmetsp:Transcript_14413/g.27428  ORF Transcript_14413/g.27428 Transcript_14413/m.27428 type:complete len:225 (-) Transcript_14413:662-1336(-)
MSRGRRPCPLPCPPPPPPHPLLSPPPLPTEPPRRRRPRSPPGTIPAPPRSWRRPRPSRPASDLLLSTWARTAPRRPLRRSTALLPRALTARTVREDRPGSRPCPRPAGGCSNRRRPELLRLRREVQPRSSSTRLRLSRLLKPLSQGRITREPRRPPSRREASPSRPHSAPGPTRRRRPPSGSSTRIPTPRCTTARTSSSAPPWFPPRPDPPRPVPKRWAGPPAP